MTLHIIFFYLTYVCINNMGLQGPTKAILLIYYRCQAYITTYQTSNSALNNLGSVVGEGQRYLADPSWHVRVQRRELAEPLEQVREPHHQCVVTGNKEMELAYFHASRCSLDKNNDFLLV